MQNIEKYFSDDTIFNAINTMFITLKTEDVKETNMYLHLVINKLIENMKLNDSLFKQMFQNNTYCGSFYKCTKIQKPNEFDLNIILKLPFNYNCIQFLEISPGYIQIKIRDEAYDNYIYKNLTYKEKNTLHKYITPSSIVNPNKFRFWIKSIIYKVFNKLQKFENMYILIINDSRLTAHIKIRESGPAFTLIFNIPHKTGDIYVDLVPALSFHTSVLQELTSKFHILEKRRNKMWFAIPIQLHNNSDHIKPKDHTNWRIAFSLQEIEILKLYGNIKPVIRQMKKFRDVQKLNGIVSYYIENLFLSKVIEGEININKIPKTLLLFKMLEELYYAYERREIKWFWNEKYNLLSRIGESELYNICHRLKNIIDDIKKNYTDQFIIAKYILNVNEFETLQIRIQNNDAHQEQQENNIYQFIIRFLQNILNI